MSLSGFKKAIFFIGAIILILGVAALGDYFRSKLVQPSAEFTAKAQQAGAESQKIDLDNFISRETVYKGKSRFGFGIVCSFGSYQTQTSSGNGTWCKKGFSKYYGLPDTDTATLEQLDEYLKMHDWQPFGESGSLENLKKAVQMNDRVGSVYYVNKDGLRALLAIARTDMKRSGSLCTSTFCQLAERKYVAVAEISIYYETKPF